MRSRIDALKKLVELYTAVEELHAMELQAAMLHTQRTWNVAEQEQSETIRASTNARRAFVDGNQLQASIFESVRKSASWRRQHLNKLYLVRKELSDAAQEQYFASRMRRAQVESVATELVEQAQVRDGRKAQMAADDRYLARQIWQTSRCEFEPDR